MEISDHDLRALVRESIERHAVAAARPSLNVADSAHASHARFVRLTPTDDGQCVIEPAVRCNHCGYCQSYGH